VQIHYDDAGVDINEAIEVIYPTSLTGVVTLALYDGNAGGNYGNFTITLSAGQPIGSTGFSVANVSTPVNGIQNGGTNAAPAPDGLALVCGSEVIQFLSYEGVFTAVGGPAAGLVSTDIGVAEAGETLICFVDAPVERFQICSCHEATLGSKDWEQCLFHMDNGACRLYVQAPNSKDSPCSSRAPERSTPTSNGLRIRLPALAL
jgi:hypothetical protein